VNSNRLRWLLRGILVVIACGFLGNSFRTCWTRLSTDFPNYYTAARAVRLHLPLSDFYDWTWFVRQMNAAGIENQLGAYTPQTPLTMLPFVPLAGLPAQEAKRVWLIADLLFLGAVVAMLARSTGLYWESIAFLLVSGYGSLQSNFAYGQYYVFLLFLITLTFYCLDRGLAASSGFVAGAAAGLKLYGGPLLLYFAAKRQWRALAGMLVSLAGLALVALALFGWPDLWYYFTHVLPRTLEGGSIDPYNPGVPTISTLLHRVLLPEPSLNSHPAIQAPGLFFFLQGLLPLGLLAFTVLGIAFRRDAEPRCDFAWFVIALLLLSTSVASYSFILLLTPVALLLRNAPRWRAVWLVVSYILLNANLQPAWLFPKVWLFAGLYAGLGWSFWRAIPVRTAAWTAAAVVLLALGNARGHMAEYAKEPGRRYSQIAAAPGALFSGYPVITPAGLFYQAMGDHNRGQNVYVLRWLHDGANESLVYRGSALQPRPSDGGVEFDLVVGRTSTAMRFDPTTRTVAAIRAPPWQTAATFRSPDGTWVAFTKDSAAGRELWIQEIVTGHAERLAGGLCNNSNPAWELDSRAVVFASDCGRAFGLPALYRAPVPFKR